jgi:hypothetical protein
LKRPNENQKKCGQSVVEYVLVGACVGLALITALATLKPQLFKNLFKSSMSSSHDTLQNGQLEMTDLNDPF